MRGGRYRYGDPLVRKGRSAKRLPGGEIGEGGKCREGIPDTQEKATVAEAPEILAMVVETPRRPAEDAAGGKLEQESIDVTVLIVRRIVGDALEEAAGTEGDEEMLIVHVVEREHGAAGEEELGGERLETQGFEGDAERGVRIARQKRWDKEEEHKKAEETGGAGRSR